MAVAMEEAGLTWDDLFNNPKLYDDLIDKYEMGTNAFCELFDGVFGEGTSEKLMGKEPYYRLCMDVYWEFVAALPSQGDVYGKKMAKTLSQFQPAGPKGAKGPVN